jgi:hypothetical protein
MTSVEELQKRILELSSKKKLSKVLQNELEKLEDQVEKMEKEMSIPVKTAIKNESRHNALIRKRTTKISSDDKIAHIMSASHVNCTMYKPKTEDQTTKDIRHMYPKAFSSILIILRHFGVYCNGNIEKNPILSYLVDSLARSEVDYLVKIRIIPQQHSKIYLKDDIFCYCCVEVWHRKLWTKGEPEFRRTINNDVRANITKDKISFKYGRKDIEIPIDRFGSKKDDIMIFEDCDEFDDEIKVDVNIWGNIYKNPIIPGNTMKKNWHLSCVQLLFGKQLVKLVKSRDYPAAFKCVHPNEKTKDFCKEALDIDGHNLQYVPDHIINDELCRESLKINHRNRESFGAFRMCNGLLQYVPKRLKTKELCEFAVEYNEGSLQHVPLEFVDLPLCQKSLKCDPDSIIFVPEEIITTEMCKSAISRSSSAFEMIPEKFMSLDLVHFYVENFGTFAYSNIPKKYQTPELKKFAEKCENQIRQAEYDDYDDYDFDDDDDY